MGIAIANRLAREGAKVSLVAGPVETGSLYPGISLLPVVSALEMHKICMEIFPETDIAVMTAAVSDFRPANQAEMKIKRSDKKVHLDLVPNPDIAASLGALKKGNQLLVGFALETDEGIEAALEKKVRKNFDLIVLNSLSDKGAGFGLDTNRISIIGPDNKPHKFELKSKTEVAGDIVDAIFAIFEN